MTNQVKHTPGPWINNGGVIEGPGGHQDVICKVGRTNYQTFNDTGNARIIAAAPDMYEAIKLMASYSFSGLASNEKNKDRKLQQIINVANKILDKAEGK